jgi:hypothetical protein
MARLRQIRPDLLNLDIDNNRDYGEGTWPRCGLSFRAFL